MAKLTRQEVRDLKPGEAIKVLCNNACELDSAYQTAHQIRRELTEAGTLHGDGLFISRSAREMFVRVQRYNLMSTPRLSRSR